MIRGEFRTDFGGMPGMRKDVFHDVAGVLDIQARGNAVLQQQLPAGGHDKGPENAERGKAKKKGSEQNDSEKGDARAEKAGS